MNQNNLSVIRFAVFCLSIVLVLPPCAVIQGQEDPATPTVTPAEQALKLGAQAMAAYDYELALEKSTEALQQEPSCEAYLVRATAYFHLGDLDSARNDLDLCLAITPDYVPALMGLAELHTRTGDLEEAFSVYSTAFDATDDPIMLGIIFSSRASTYIGLEDYDNALEDLESALELDPQNVLALSNRGHIFTLEGDLDAALAMYSRAIEIDATNYEFLIERAQIYQYQGEIELAFDDFDAAITLNPNAGTAYAGRGLVYLLREDFSHALEDLNQALVLIAPEEVYSDLYLDRGFVYMQMDEMEKAIDDFSSALKIEPEYVYPLKYRGIAYYYQEEYELALADLNQYLAHIDTVDLHVVGYIIWIEDALSSE